MKKKNNKKNKIKFEGSAFGSPEVKKVVITTSVVLIVFACFYFLTVAILNKDTDASSTDTDSSSDTSEVEIQHEEILLGSSFSIKDSQYLVVYYDTNDDDLSSLTSAISTYRSGSKELSLYTVNMGDGLNKGFISDASNKEATKASELSISGPSLIKFSNNKIDTYIEGMDEIIDYLES